MRSRTSIEGVAVGDEIPPFVVASVSAEKMKTMAAIIRDPNPIHFDVEVTRALGLGDRVVNQGPSNMAYIVNALIAWAGSAAAVRNLRCRFNGNVFAGDRVEASGTVTAVEPGLDEAGRQVTMISCDVWLDRDGDLVVTGTARVVVPAASG
ncbi:MaoC family dehydratase [Euzebya tangerina]|uniref:MaoC family dehydratase n=1 Tax=Euzebya tangerina TaxID=591198 RepID=UPI00196B49BB|nr:MaoC family dehydratase [Euzebya tangerina]